MEGVWIKTEALIALKEQVEQLKQQLAALRQRIDDAPVVAWAGSEVRSVSPGVTKTTMTGPLISKEDLQK